MPSASCSLVQQNAASRPSRSWSRNPAGSNHGSRSRWASVSAVQPPCSGWPAKARLLTASQASSSRPGSNGRVGDVDGQAGRERRGASGAARAVGVSPAAAASVVVGVVGVERPPLHRAAAVGGDDVDGGGEQVAGETGVVAGGGVDDQLDRCDVVGRGDLGVGDEAVGSPATVRRGEARRGRRARSSRRRWSDSGYRPSAAAAAASSRRTRGAVEVGRPCG